MKYYKRPIQEHNEGDYLITTERIGNKKSKENLIIKQLLDLGLEEGKNFKVVEESCSDSEDKERKTILISIDLPDSFVDRAASDLELDACIKNNQSLTFIKQKFDIDLKNNYFKFDASARDDAIDDFLQRELDYKYYIATGVIKDHQFMHKSNNIEEIQKSWNSYKNKLMFSFLSFSGSYLRYLQPINMIKNYYGEKQAFLYAYTLHYQAFLIIPTIGGVLVFFNTMFQYANKGDRTLE